MTFGRRRADGMTSWWWQGVSNTIDNLKDRHEGQTVYVLGSGSSLGFIEPSFFADKITITMPLVCTIYGINPTYVFNHHHEPIEIGLETGATCVVLERDCESRKLWEGPQPDNLRFFTPAYYWCLTEPHGNCVDPHGHEFDPFKHPPLEGSLLYGSSSLHGAMHLAAYLGAKFIVLVGADCGSIDGNHRISDYEMESSEQYTQWIWSIYNEHHRLVKNWLKENYDCNVYSLNPFINFNLEGHTFEGV
jgi:hypothetical protein